MGEGVTQRLIDHIREMAGQCWNDPRTDTDLLTAFVGSGDEEAFAALVLRC